MNPSSPEFPIQLALLDKDGGSWKTRRRLTFWASASPCTASIGLRSSHQATGRHQDHNYLPCLLPSRGGDRQPGNGEEAHELGLSPHAGLGENSLELLSYGPQSMPEFIGHLVYGLAADNGARDASLGRCQVEQPVQNVFRWRVWCGQRRDEENPIAPVKTSFPAPLIGRR